MAGRNCEDVYMSFAALTVGVLVFGLWEYRRPRADEEDRLSVDAMDLVVTWWAVAFMVCMTTERACSLWKWPSDGALPIAVAVLGGLTVASLVWALRKTRRWRIERRRGGASRI